MHTAEEKLKERIKELTCLYEVTSVIIHAENNEYKTVFEDTADCLQRAWQFDEETYVNIKVNDSFVETRHTAEDYVFLQAPIATFNEEIGRIKVGYPAPKYSLDDFLIEEQQLLDNICIKLNDMLKRKEIKEKELRSRRQVEQADRLLILGEIAAGIAHELNTPLTNIIGFTELLKEHLGSDHIALKDLDKIINNTIFSREVVKKLMFFACEMPQERQHIDILPVIMDAMGLLRSTLRKHKVSCELHTRKEEVFLHIDKIQLTQVLFNIIMNAVYFSPGNSVITITVKQLQEKVLLQIADQGVGIREEQGKRVFDPFYSSKPVGDGSGLGLSVVHGIVQSNDGKISHRPNKNRGTVFEIEFNSKKNNAQ